MAKPILQNKAQTSSLLCIVATLVFQILTLPLWSFIHQWLQSSSSPKPKPVIVCPQKGVAPINATTHELSDPTFYDDPATSYTIDKPELDWDQKRAHWLKLHPTFLKSPNRLLLITGSQPSACREPLGDQFLLRFFKNKVDYCRINGCKIFYNNVFMDPEMPSVWSKLPLLRAAMVAHPDVEWLLWMDSDAMFTDMDFKFPLDKYGGYNLVVPGWPDLLYEKKTWLAVNAGVFLMRNCQWAMEFLDVWADMGPKSPDYRSWGEILSSTLKDRILPEADEQSALIYLILKGEKRRSEKIFVEHDYVLHGYWLWMVGKYDDIEDKYEEMEKGAAGLRRRHAEAARGGYAEERGRLAEEGGWRWPFVTHFTGCRPCTGDHNPEFEEGACDVGMERALNFADNQVLRNFGFVHPDARNYSLVTPRWFNYPVVSES